MKVVVVGAGYVGLVTGVCLASKGIDVVCVDVDKEKVDLINSGKSPIYEKGLEKLLNSVLNKNFKATDNLKSALEDAELAMICVGTPSKEDGSIDLKYVEKAFDEITENSNDLVIAVKSTVIPGTTDYLKNKVKEKNFSFAMNPEFLKEGVAVNDFLNPDRIIIGCSDEKAKKVMKELYSSFNCPKLFTDLKTAEMVKYASNSFLATKISFINELGNICKKLGINVYEVAEGMGYDKRIERKFLNAGVGFGGSCFPKDVKALINKAEEIGYNPKILKSVINVNEKQPLKLIELAEKHFDLKGKKVTVLGVAFKSNTDDIREAPALKIINKLIEKDVEVTIFDPKAMNNAKKVFGEKIKYANNVEKAVEGKDVVFIVTDWEEFKKPELYKNILVIDGRKIINKKEDYEGVCW